MSELPPEALAPDPGRRRRCPGPRRRRRSRRPTGTSPLAWRVLGAVVVVACCIVVLWQLNPRLLLRDTTANGGDMGAHVWFPAYLRDHLLPHWRVAGWSPDWFAGFPAGQFYFPVPAVITVVLDVVMPYNVAFKLVDRARPVLMPAGAYGLGRGMNMRRPGPELVRDRDHALPLLQGRRRRAPSPTTATTIQFNQRIMGGPIVSALAGEYSFSLALTFATRVPRRARVLVAHGSPALARRGAARGRAVATSSSGSSSSSARSDPRGCFHRPIRLPRTSAGCAVGAVGALLTAFWSVPLLATFAYTANMRYEKLTWYVDYLFPGELLVGVRAGGDRRRHRARPPGPRRAHPRRADAASSPSSSGCGPSCTRGTCGSSRSGTSGSSCSPPRAWPRCVRGAAQ